MTLFMAVPLSGKASRRRCPMVGSPEYPEGPLIGGEEETPGRKRFLAGSYTPAPLGVIKVEDDGAGAQREGCRTRRREGRGSPRVSPCPRDPPGSSWSR